MVGSKKSTSSVNLQRRTSSRKSNTGSKKSKGSLEITSTENSNIIEEEEIKPIKIINYRDELTFLFLYSMFDDVIQDREVFPCHKSVDMSILSKATSDDSLTVVLRDSPDYEVSMIPLEGSKSVQSKISRKSSPESVTKLSKKSSGKEGSSNILDAQSKISQETSIEEGLMWVIETQDQYEKITFKNGNSYRGQTSKYLMHGQGTFHWSDGTIYEGSFKNGYPDGNGKVVLPDLSKYEGDFCKGYYHGNGILFIASSPVMYSGSWKNGKKDGKGWLLYCTNDSYDGEWLEDEKHGFGNRQYKNGAKYKGKWKNNKMNGEGTMLWENNDYYIGDWMDSKPHGYGEYTWNVFFNRSFTFPYYNWYKGSWIEGLRTGAGIMNFGTESGAKLAGIWKNNYKHGAGVMICGNGLTLERNPLFENDKPVHKTTPTQAEPITDRDSAEESKSEESQPTGNEENSEIIETESPKSESGEKSESEEESQSEKGSLIWKNSYREIIKEINSKVAMKTFDDAILTRITKSGLNISESQFVKLEISDSEHEQSKEFYPLEIPIHTVAEEVNLGFYIEIILDYYYEKAEDMMKTLQRISNDISEEVKFGQTSNSRGNIVETKQKSSLNAAGTGNIFQYDKNNEERILRNIITVHLPQLTEIYNQYATIAGNKDANFKSVLIRLFLWQLYRDIELPHQGVTLMEADIFLADNPSSCIESIHYPFEPIYFWQFLQSLFGCSWLLFLSKKSQRYENFTNGTIGKIFKDFLDEDVFPNVGKFQGVSLTEYKDLLPIQLVYDLYLKIGESHSAREFLYFTCTKKGKDPPCSVALNGDMKLGTISEGNNAVPIGNQVLYLRAKDEEITSRNDPPTQDENSDAFSKSLYTFRKLGKKKIFKCLTKICPRICFEGKVNTDYKINFLEFYEVVLLCAYEKAERKRRIIEICNQALKEPSIVVVPKATKDKGGKKKK